MFRRELSARSIKVRMGWLEQSIGAFISLSWLWLPLPCGPLANVPNAQEEPLGPLPQESLITVIT